MNHKVKTYFKTVNFRLFINSFILLPLLLIHKPILGQNILKARTNFTASCKKDQLGNWGEWSNSEESDLLVVINLKDSYIKVYSLDDQKYMIASVESNETQEGESNYLFSCVDNNGVELVVILKLWEDSPETGSLTIVYSHISWVYLLHWLTD